MICEIFCYFICLFLCFNVVYYILILICVLLSLIGIFFIVFCNTDTVPVMLYNSFACKTLLEGYCLMLIVDSHSIFVKKIKTAEGQPFQDGTLISVINESAKLLDI